MDELPRLRRSVQSLLAELGRDVAIPDPHLADGVLVLSCAVSERVDAASPVHRDTLAEDIEEVMLVSARAADVSGDEAGGLARRIARMRAGTDLRVAAARETGEGEYFEIKARFGGDPGYAEKEIRDACRVSIETALRRLDDEPPRPSGIERRVARAVVATRGTEWHGLALAMAEALERGTVPTADAIRKERKAVVARLGEGTEGMGPYAERTFLTTVCGIHPAGRPEAFISGSGA